MFECSIQCFLVLRLRTSDFCHLQNQALPRSAIPCVTEKKKKNAITQGLVRDSIQIWTKYLWIIAVNLRQTLFKTNKRFLYYRTFPSNSWTPLLCMYVCMYVCSPLKPLDRLNLNFIWSLLGAGKRKFVQMVQVTWPRWQPCPYLVKNIKILLWNQKTNDLETWCATSGVQVLPSLFKWWPWVDLDLFYGTARSNLIPYAFVWEKGKTNDFQKLLW